MELIDRNELIEKLDGIWDCNDMVFEPDDCCDIISDCKSCKWRETKEAIKRIVLHMPTIEAVSARHGEWLPGIELSREYVGNVCVSVTFEDWRCSICGTVVEQPNMPLYKYCPNCGALMGERREG